jgi:thymidylate synthase ThyX
MPTVPDPDRDAAAQIQESCKQIALQLMKIHPAVPKLGDQETQDNCFQALHRLTIELETIKKQIIKLQKRDTSGLL